MNTTFRNILIILLLTANFGCDQISKSVVRERIPYQKQISFFNNHFTLTKVENTGAFLSTGNAWPAFVKVVFLNILPAFVLVVTVFWMVRKKDLNFLQLSGMGCLAGGGMGNLYDRFIHGSVTDFLHMDFIIFQTGIFNFADVSVSVGVFILLWSFWRQKQADKAT